MLCLRLKPAAAAAAAAAAVVVLVVVRASKLSKLFQHTMLSPLLFPSVDDAQLLLPSFLAERLQRCSEKIEKFPPPL